MDAKPKVSGPPRTDRRALAAELLERDYSIRAVAELPGLSPATARRYHAMYRADGKRALMRLGDVGRRRNLPAEGVSWLLVAAIKHSPAVHGFPGSHWPNDAVSELINRQFQIRYSRSHINALIRELGLRERVLSVSARGDKKERYILGEDGGLKRTGRLVDVLWASSRPGS